jgi:predicted transcriptional regulator
MDNERDLENRKKICNYIEYHPGNHLTKIAEMLEMKIVEVDGLLQDLESQKKVYSIKADGYAKYYISRDWKRSRQKKTQKIRDEILTLLRNNQGVHLSSIADHFHMNLSLAKYHLRQLERENQIIAVKDERGYFKRYYTSDSNIGRRQKEIIEMLRKELPFKIILLLIKHQSMRHKDIATILRISPSNLTYHLNLLEINQIINVQTYGKEKGYSIKNRNEIIGILDTYILKIELHRVLENFAFAWDKKNEETSG